MTSSGTSSGTSGRRGTGRPGPPEPPLPPARHAARSIDDSYLGGVAGGLAAHLGVDARLVRAFFVVTSITGFGLVLYAGLWLTLPLATAPEQSPGLAAATRQGRRPGARGTIRDAGPLVALGAVLIGVAALVDLTFGGHVVFWPAALAVVGVMVLWRQADEAQRERWIDGSGRLDLRRVVLGDGGPAAWTRLATGIALLVVALVLFAAQTGRVGVARDMVVAGGLGVLGLAIALGPWLTRLASDLSEERAARIRSQERADVAAHLHDSVLQTLALIQRNAGDSGQVARLARAQERDLRQWLYGETTTSPSTLAAALKACAAEVEDAHGIPVEVVTVGDVPVGEEVVPVVRAAREAMANAARHSGAPKVDVYAEVAGRSVDVFVRDRGRGFDLAAVPADRLGVRNSIVDRMERHGGTATVRSTAGEGTEVRLHLKVAPSPEHPPEERRTRGTDGPTTGGGDPQ